MITARVAPTTIHRCHSCEMQHGNSYMDYYIFNEHKKIYFCSKKCFDDWNIPRNAPKPLRERIWGCITCNVPGDIVV